MATATDGAGRSAGSCVRTVWITVWRSGVWRSVVVVVVVVVEASGSTRSLEGGESEAHLRIALEDALARRCTEGM